MEKVLIQGFAVNKSKINRITQDGKNIIILANVLACRSNSVMNGLYYPASFVVNNFEGLEGTLAPVGHPKKANGELVASTDAMAINDYHAGAWNKNARINKNGDVYLDIHIDEKYAANSEKGRELLARIEQVENGKSDHLWTSTGLYYESDNKAGITANGVKYQGSIIGGKFEHNAILLDELPAGGDTGFTVNNLNETHDLRKPKNKMLAFFGITSNAVNINELSDEIQVALNSRHNGDSVITHVYDNYFIYHNAGNLYKRSYKIAGNEIQMKKAVQVDLNFKEIATNKESAEEMTEDQIKQILANALKESDNKFEAQLAELKAENEALKMQVNESKAEILKEQREAVKARFELSDEAVSSLTGNALKELYAKTQTSAPILGGNSSKQDNALFVDFNALIDNAEGK